MSHILVVTDAVFRLFIGSLLSHSCLTGSDISPCQLRHCCRHSPYDIVSLISISLEHRDMPCLKYAFDIRHSLLYILGSLLALSLIRRVGLVAECLAMVESDSEMCGSAFRYYLVEHIDETEDGTRVHPFRVDARCA